MQQQYFHGIGKKYPYFEGWYLKHQNEGKTIAFIPAVHADQKGSWSASIQVVTDEGAWYFTYPIELCRINRRRFYVKIGENVFSEKGMKVQIESAEISVQGRIRYTKFHKIKGDIMGFFRWIPFLQCHHGVISMSHDLSGSLKVSGKNIREENINFTGGRGYIETDWGSSFPDTYIWSQCVFGIEEKNSIMVSAADVPVLGLHLPGCICAIHYKGREFRLGTYYGARIKEYGPGTVTITQGIMTVKVTRQSNHSFQLHAPQEGNMKRLIKESPACLVRYQFWMGRVNVFDVISDRGSYEEELGM
ncbi:MAG: hypothetical protein MSA90_14675 [Faecalicatena sp.]|uniref:tocopherol cyclase family protein n=1 Tax=Faecalicatena sp. TaxID=2005360 RepID=UPI0025842BD4|nr:tocopherol cyclase family protein [Faecalicatena sp.]MCI6466695.1 hypothetical protein [Faecalicatena sp.]MDY5620669.1 tocopherol cyclase family protein [Lachnospiraceae bacterium]